MVRCQTLLASLNHQKQDAGPIFCQVDSRIDSFSNCWLGKTALPGNVHVLPLPDKVRPTAISSSLRFATPPHLIKILLLVHKIGGMRAEELHLPLKCRSRGNIP